MNRFLHWVLFFYLLQILTQAVVDLGSFRQLFPRYATLLRRIGFHESPIHRQLRALYQTQFYTLPHDLLKQLFKQLRFLKPSVSILRERGVMRNLLIEAETGEPAPCQMHAQFFHQLAFTGDAIQITDQQNAQQKLGVNRWATGLTVGGFQLLPYKLETDVLVDESQQMILRNLIFQAEVIEQRLTAGMVPHHDQQASNHRNPAKHDSF